MDGPDHLSTESTPANTDLQPDAELKDLSLYLPEVQRPFEPVHAADVSAQHKGSSSHVTLEEDTTLTFNSVRDCVVAVTNTPLVFLSTEGGIQVIAESHLLQTNLIADANALVDSTNWPGEQEAVALETPALFLAGPASQNFFHWMHDCLPRVLAFEKTGLQASLFVPEANDSNSFIRESLHMLGIPDERIVEHRDNAVLASELWFAEDLLPLQNEHGHQILLNELRTNLLKQISPATDFHRSDRRIFIAREDDQKPRTLANSAQIESLLIAQYGFEKVLMESLSLSDQIRIAAESSEVIAPHGAGLFHTLFMSEGRVVELFPLHPDRSSASNKILVDPCWFRIQGAHVEQKRQLQWETIECEVEMMSNTDFNKYRLHVDPEALQKAIQPS